ETKGIKTVVVASPAKQSLTGSAKPDGDCVVAALPRNDKGFRLSLMRRMCRGREDRDAAGSAFVFPSITLPNPVPGFMPGIHGFGSAAPLVKTWVPGTSPGTGE